MYFSCGFREVNAHEDNHQEQVPLQMFFDFTDNVAEAVVMMAVNDSDGTEAA